MSKIVNWLPEPRRERALTKYTMRSTKLQHYLSPHHDDIDKNDIDLDDEEQNTMHP